MRKLNKMDYVRLNKFWDILTARANAFSFEQTDEARMTYGCLNRWYNMEDEVWRTEIVKSYSKLNEELSNLDGLPKGRALHDIRDYCAELSFPPLTGLIVAKQTGFPSSGYQGDRAGEGYLRKMKSVLVVEWLDDDNPYSTLVDQGISNKDIVNDILENPDGAGQISDQVPGKKARKKGFKDALLKAYDKKCCFCGLAVVEILEGAHIIPYSKSTPHQQMSPRNGLLLCRHHHKLYDDKVITFSADFELDVKIPIAHRDKPFYVNLLSEMAEGKFRYREPNEAVYLPNQDWINERN